MGENDFVQWLRERLPSHPLLQLGPGDDAAVLRRCAGGESVLTTDLLADGTHFDLRRDDPVRVGHKALGVNLSDVAAMAAQPRAALVTLLLPRAGGGEIARALYEGMLPLAARYDVAIAGGDTNAWDGPLVIGVTLVGATTPRGPLTRGGARPGDALVVSGALGGSLLGRHLDVEPRISEALLLHERYILHAGIDLSDGLALDLERLCAESGVGAELDLAAVPIADAARELARRDGRTPIAHALQDGEDFELLLAVGPDDARQMIEAQPLDVPLTAIGHLTAEPGLWHRDADGRHPIEAAGYEHTFS